jgi:Zn-dependent M28 family amino/carboxypeptidase
MTHAQRPATSTAFDGQRAWQHLTEIVAIGPRPAGSPGLRRTRAYITRQLGAMGLTTHEQPFTATTPVGPVEMVNLAVRLPGRRPDRILVAGHYDTKRMPGVFVGANDGGSSAAFLIELARVLHTRPLEFTVELVWFDGEEAVMEWQGQDHTYGSRHYVQAARTAGALAAIRALVLVDMIADRDLELRRDPNSTGWLVDLIWDTAARLGHQQTFVDRTFAVEDDHLRFIEAGIPAVDLIDLDYPAWHTPADTLEQVSARGLQIVGDVVLASLPAIERRLTAP